MAEQTAAVIWRMLRHVGQPVFLWNVFPFHPHPPDAPFSNRCHTAAERRMGDFFLRRIMELPNPDAIIAIGANAHSATCALGIPCTGVRHPSYGGRNAFVTQIKAAYDLPDFEDGSLFSNCT